MAAIAQVQNPERTVGFKRVLVATDFSAASEHALAYALPLTRRYGSAVSIVHAILPEPREAVTLDPPPRELDREWCEAQEQMDRLAKEPGIMELRPHMLLARGRAWDVLSSIMENDDTDLLVLGTHGRGGLKKLALGSVAEEVLRRAACPVLTVGPNVPPLETGTNEFKTILFATDFGPAAAKAFPCALSLAEDCQANLILLHIVPPMPVNEMGPVVYCPAVYLAQELTEWQAATKESSLRRLKALLPSSANLSCQPEYLVGFNFVPEGILDTAAAHNADLIVMGAHPVASARAASHAPWALTHDVICRAGCPVLTVRS
jgi:nucleotide-binding universal stress UspA family protein